MILGIVERDALLGGREGAGYIAPKIGRRPTAMDGFKDQISVSRSLSKLDKRVCPSARDIRPAVEVGAEPQPPERLELPLIIIRGFGDFVSAPINLFDRLTPVPL